MLAAANDLQRHTSAYLGIRDKIRDCLIRRNLLPVHLHDHVALDQASASARGTWHNGPDELSSILRNSKRRSKVLIDRLETDAEISARGPLTAHQSVDDWLCRLGGYCK